MDGWNGSQRQVGSSSRDFERFLMAMCVVGSNISSNTHHHRTQQHKCHSTCAGHVSRVGLSRINGFQSIIRRAVLVIVVENIDFESPSRLWVRANGIKYDRLIGDCLLSLVHAWMIVSKLFF